MASFDDRHYVIWQMIVLFCEIYGAVSFVHLLTRGQQLIVDSGESVNLECEFYTDDFNLFDNPILWRKTQLHETTQMNMMGNLMEPYSSAGRFRVSFVQQAPRYILGMTVNGIKHEDSGNYTCEVYGPHNILLGFVTHYIYVRSAIETLLLLSDNATDYLSGGQAEQLEYTENVPGVLRCVAVGGYPPADLTVYIGRRETTADFGHAHSARLTGSRGLRTIEYTAERWSRDLSPRAADDGKIARCVATVAGLAPNSTQSRMIVNYAPIISCQPGSAYMDEFNAFVKCEIRARPWATNVYWMLDLNGTTISKGESVSKFWTTVMDRGDGALETCLYMRRANAENFRVYTLIAANSIDARSQQVELVQKFRTTPPPAHATPRSGYSRKGSSTSSGSSSNSHGSRSISDIGDLSSDKYRSGVSDRTCLTIRWQMPVLLLTWIQLFVT